MTEISFEYNGRKHSGQVISSTHIEPHYHWFCFDDSELVKLLKDDCIGFKKTGDGLSPTRLFVQHQELVETVRQMIQQRIG
ncbi:MAG TPA: hypothetical protein VF145_01555 [Chitinophagaceae bacterium]